MNLRHEDSGICSRRVRIAYVCISSSINVSVASRSLDCKGHICNKSKAMFLVKHFSSMTMNYFDCMTASNRSSY